MNFTEIISRQIQVARVYGIPVRIDYRWFAVVALSAYMIAYSFRQGSWYVAGVEWPTAWAVGILTTAIFFLSIFGHELAHAVVGRAEGIDIEEIVLHPFGGLARMRREPDSPRAEFRIAVAGPAASFIFALLAFAGLSLAEMGGYRLASAVFFIIGSGNLLIAVFNLFPGYPLDGGRVLRALLWHRTGRLEEATRTVSLGGQLIAWILIVLGVYVAVAWGAYLMGVWSVLVGFFLRGAAASVMTQARGESLRTVADAMSAPVSVEPDALVSHFIDAMLPLHRHAAMPVAHDRRLHGIVTLEDLKKLPRESWPRTRISEVMRPVDPHLFVDASTPLARAETMMNNNGAGALAVVNDAGELVGFLRHASLKRRAKP